MNPLRAAALAVTALAATAHADRVMVVGSQRDLVHDSIRATTQSFTSAGLAELAMDAFGLPTGNLVRLSNSVEPALPVIQSPAQADVFEHVDAYTLVFIDAADASVLDKLNVGNAGYSKVFELANGAAAEKIPVVLAKELTSSVGATDIKCAGSTAICEAGVLPVQEADAAQFNKVFAANTYLNRQNADDVLFAQELAQTQQLIESIAKGKATNALYVTNFASVNALDASKRVAARASIAKTVSELLEAVQRAYPQSGAQIVASSGAALTRVNDVVSYSRMLLSFTDVSASDDEEEDAGNATLASNSTVSLEDIAEYQIVLWTSVILGVALLLVLMAMCNMDTKRDSLLYAKFITSNAGRKYD